MGFAAMGVAKVTFNVPFLVYKWLDKGGYAGFIQVDLLMLSGACKEDVDVQIMPDESVSRSSSVFQTCFCIHVYLISRPTPMRGRSTEAS